MILHKTKIYNVSLTLYTADSIKSWITTVRTIAVNMMALFIIQAMSTPFGTVLAERISVTFYECD